MELLLIVVYSFKNTNIHVVVEIQKTYVSEFMNAYLYHKLCMNIHNFRTLFRFLLIQEIHFYAFSRKFLRESELNIFCIKFCYFLTFTIKDVVSLLTLIRWICILSSACEHRYSILKLANISRIF